MLVIIQEAYFSDVYEFSVVSALAFVVYATMLNIPREAEYIWLSPKPLSLATLFYALTRYGTLMGQILQFWLSCIPAGGSLCNVLTDAEYATIIVTVIGTQGITVIRVYALCQGNKVILWALIFLSTGYIIASICSDVIFGGCFLTSQTTSGATFDMLTAAEDILIIVMESVVFSVCLWNVWGIYKLKSETGIRNRNDLVSIIRRQVLSQFCFSIFSVGALAIASLIGLNNDVVTILGTFQQNLIGIMIANFTLDLRQQNAAFINARNITLPSLHFRSVLDYMHQSIVVEMSDHENDAMGPVMEGGDGGHDSVLMGFPEVELRHEESA